MANYDFTRCDAEINGAKPRLITDLNYTTENGAKFEPTFGGGGISYGAVQISGSFNYKIARNAPANAPERKWEGYVHNKKTVSAVFTNPFGNRIVFAGAFSKVDTKSAVDGATDGSIDFTGTGRLIVS